MTDLIIYHLVFGKGPHALVTPLEQTSASYYYAWLLKQAVSYGANPEGFPEGCQVWASFWV